MPHLSRRVLSHPAVLLLAAVVLVAAGILLWPDAPTGAARGASSGGVVPPRPGPAAQGSTAAHTAGTPGPPTDTVGSGDGQDLPQALPPAVAEAATAFTVAWASHDARPGKDRGYGDAALRAAQFAGDGLADWLRTPSERPPLVWQEWTRTQALVTAQVTSLHLPDGAPAPTEHLAYARVFYRVTVAPAQGESVWSDAQVALELRTGSDGSWAVTALPNA